ncbi:MAG: hypothetical protein SFW67_35590 [Myxococcaceae bacterium]|nr:hypothetical protein [Myxococcaceae bacterium]
MPVQQSESVVAGRYWAALPSQEAAREAGERLEQHINRLRLTGRLDSATALLREYYSSTRAGRTGLGQSTGGTVIHRVNEVRPIIQQLVALVAAERPGLKAVAGNNDYASEAEARVADQLLTAWRRSNGLPVLEMAGLRGSLLAHSWYVVAAWQQAMGAPYTKGADGRLIYEGDVEYHSLPPWRVATSRASTQKLRRWAVYASAADIHELRAQYPAQANAIQPVRTQAAASNSWGNRVAEALNGVWMGTELAELLGDALTQDETWLFEFRHVPTPALPQGRLLRWAAPDVVLFDSMSFDGEDVGYPYDDLLVHEVAPERVVGTSVGHTGAQDLLATQQLLDGITSAIATNANLFANLNLWMPRGSAVDVEELEGAGRIIKTATKPEALDFPSLQPEHPQLVEMLRDTMKANSGINNVITGNPDKNMPAKAMALLRAQSVQFHQPTQAEYFALVEFNASAWLSLMKRFATTQRTSELLGVAGAERLKQWSADAVGGVKRFEIEAVNPATTTYEGRLALADDLLAKGLVSREGYLSLLQTGSIEDALERPTSQLELLSRHKEMLRQGCGLPPIDMAATQAQLQAALAAGLPPTSVAPVFLQGEPGKQYIRLLKTDPHHIAYAEYASVLDDPGNREKADVVEAVTGVLEETKRLWASLTPDELMALQMPALPSSMGLAPPPDDEGDEAVPGDAGEPEERTEAAAGMPRPPPNPITGAQEGPDALGGLA